MDNSALLRIGNRTIKVCNNSGAALIDGVLFDTEVKFSVASRSDLFTIELCEGDDELCYISGSPFTLQRLIKQQNMLRYFGSKVILGH